MLRELRRFASSKVTFSFSVAGAKSKRVLMKFFVRSQSQTSFMIAYMSLTVMVVYPLSVKRKDKHVLTKGATLKVVNLEDQMECFSRVVTCSWVM